MNVAEQQEKAQYSWLKATIKHPMLTTWSISNSLYCRLRMSNNPEEAHKHGCNHRHLFLFDSIFPNVSVQLHFPFVAYWLSTLLTVQHLYHLHFEHHFSHHI